MKKIFYTVFFFFFTFFINPQENIKYLFINTYPLKARVLIDGADNFLQTPCLLQNVNIKSQIKIEKEGYKSYTLSETDIISKKFSINLTPGSFSLYFPEKINYQIGNSDVKGPVFVSKLKSGKYDINVTNRKISFKISSDFLPLEVSFGALLGCSLGVMIGSIAASEYNASNAYYAKQSRNLIDYEYYSRSTNNADIAKMVSIGTTSLLGLALAAIIIADIVSNYKSKNMKINISNESPSNQDENFYDSAVRLMSIGELEKSSQVLESLLSLFPESELVPKVYYNLGQNYYISGDLDKALYYWEYFIRDYPVADYYDYVIKNLADVYYAKKELKTARNFLDRMVFTDNILNRELVYSFKAKLDLEIYETEESDEAYKISEEAYLALINNFPGSEQMDIYFSQLLKLYNMKSDEGKITMLKLKAENLSEINEKVKELILSQFP